MPNVVYNQGPLLTNPEVTVIYVRPHNISSDLTQPASLSWINSANGLPVDIVCTINTFLYDLVQSSFMDFLSAEFSVPGQYVIGRGRFIRGIVLDLKKDQVDNNIITIRASDIEFMMKQAIKNGMIDRPNPNTLYICITSLIKVQENDGQHTVGFNSGGYHDSFELADGTRVPYCLVDLGNSTDELTFNISHELTEAVTNPFLTGWFDVSHDPSPEVSDICLPAAVDGKITLEAIRAAGSRFHGSLLNKFWSQNQSMCIGPVDDNAVRPGGFLRITDSRKQWDTCVSGIIEGEEINFFVGGVLDGFVIPIGNVVWSASDNTPIESVNGNRMTLVAPVAGTVFTVSASATSGDWGCSLSVTQNFTSVSAETRGVQELVCTLRHELLKYWKFINSPAGNPVRDFNTHPITEGELHAYQSLGRTLNRISEAGERIG